LRAAGVLLLVLTAHAFVASSTHFHRSALTGLVHAQSTAVGSEEGGQGAPQAGDDAQCLLCRLQRNFVSGVQHERPTVAPLPAEAVKYEPLQNISVRAASALLRSGRAPPQA
jgi:hypothetical protein